MAKDPDPRDEAGSTHLPLVPHDDPDAPPSEEERRAAALLREALAATEERVAGPPGALPGPRPAVRSEEARWLAAHLRLPTADDSLGEVRARGLARAAREAVVIRRAQVQKSSWRQLGRSLTGTGGLLAAAAALLLVSWALLDQGLRMQRGLLRPLPRTTTALLLRDSLLRNESPAQRLDLMLQERLQQLRGAPLRAGGAVVARRCTATTTMLASARFPAPTLGPEGAP